LIEYRAIIAMIIRSGIKLNELEKNSQKLDMKKLMDDLKIEIRIENNETILYEKNKKIDEEYLQSKEISMAVSKLGGRTNEYRLFDFARNIIHNLAIQYNVILSARGILNIYPECDMHLFITASLDERVKRKAVQYGDKTLKEVRENIIKRDELQKEVGYYELSPITKVIDVTDCKSVKESTDKVMDTLNLALEI